MTGRKACRRRRYAASRPATARSAAGVSLVEVLVSLVVLSIGLLGLNLLTANTQKANDSSNFQSQAAVLANSILDNMRANLAAAKASQYDVVTGTLPSASTCIGATCNPAQLAQSDLYAWKTRLQAAMPGGDGSVVTATVGSFVTAIVTVTWDDKRASKAFGDCSGSSCPRSLTLESVL